MDFVKSRFRQKPLTPVEKQWREKRSTMYDQLYGKGLLSKTEKPNDGLPAKSTR